jgi:hypothetical protein
LNNEDLELLYNLIKVPFAFSCLSHRVFAGRASALLARASRHRDIP